MRGGKQSWNTDRNNVMSCSFSNSYSSLREIMSVLNPLWLMQATTSDGPILFTDSWYWMLKSYIQCWLLLWSTLSLKPNHFSQFCIVILEWLKCKIYIYLTILNMNHEKLTSLRKTNPLWWYEKCGARLKRSAKIHEYLTSNKMNIWHYKACTFSKISTTTVILLNIQCNSIQ